MKKIALIAENLCKTYGKGNTVVHALNDVSLTLHAGEIAACSDRQEQENPRF